jgi:hypothetical protein
MRGTNHSRKDRSRHDYPSQEHSRKDHPGQERSRKDSAKPVEQSKHKEHVKPVQQVKTIQPIQNTKPIQPPKKPKITFASVLGKKEELVQVKESVDTGFSTAPLAKYVPLQLPRLEAEFQTWVMYNFEHILDMRSILVDNNEDELYYTSFHFLDKLAHFLFDHSTKNIDSDLSIVESDELDEYLVKRDRGLYKE